MKKRNILLLLLVLLGSITFLDRINIAVAGPRMMADLNISPDRWGMVLSAFILSYGLFQIPLGLWGDRKGERLVLSLIVVWWSVFTGLTGMASCLGMLITVRFLFGIGEAGSYPCSTSAIGKWFPKNKRAKAQGFMWASSRIGGALTPFLVVPLMNMFGWRHVFIIFAFFGLAWGVVWFLWYRNSPDKMKGITDEELVEIGSISKIKTKNVFGQFVKSRQFWIIMGMYWFYVWGSWFFFSWLPTYLVKGRGFTEQEMKYAVALPFLMGTIGNIAGGYLSDYFVKCCGLKTGRRILGVGGLLVAAALLYFSTLLHDKLSVIICMSLSFGFMDMMLPGTWAVCLDIGGKYSGTLSGAMNTSGNIGGFVCTLVFGFIVKATMDYNVPLVVIACMMCIAAILFIFIDASRPILKE